MKTPEAVTIYTVFPISTPVSLPGSPAISVDLRQTDDIFWRVFDFSFIGGKPYDKATFDAGQPVAVLTESVVRSLFGTTDAVGREFLLNHAPYRVAGVVKDVSTLADCAYGQVWFRILLREWIRRLGTHRAHGNDELYDAGAQSG